jgi:predicted transcriptional regulator
MQIIIELDAETARQLTELQKQTNQDHTVVIQQGIGLYYQQLQPHRQFYIETKRQYELIANIPATASCN